MNTFKRIYRIDEDPNLPDFNAFCHKMKSYAPGLKEDLLRNQESIKSRLESDGTIFLDSEDRNRGYDTDDSVTCDTQDRNIEGWQGVFLRYMNEYDEEVETYTNPERWEKFPTASKIMDEYGSDLSIFIYSVLAPRTILQRHSGQENIKGKYIRMHIPLIIPEGRIFLECNHEEVDWTDVWGFDNRICHSAHNYSNEWRVVMVGDFVREAVGLPTALPIDDEIYGDENLRFELPPL